MTVLEIKKRLIKRINRTDNSKLLEEIFRLIENEETDLTIYELSELQKTTIEEAQDQYKKGDTLTDEKANSEIDKWLEATLTPNFTLLTFNS